MKKYKWISLLIIGIGLLGNSAVAEYRRPNFLIFLTDDQRQDTLGCYNADCPIKTPNLDRLAKDGIRFDNGFVTTPILWAYGIYDAHKTATRINEFGA